MGSTNATKKAHERMRQDEDIQSEARELAGANQPRTLEPVAEHIHVPLNWKPNQGGHRPNQGTLRLLQQVGGHDAILNFTERFYEKAFADPHLDQFIREHQDPHGERFANWICEKFGDGSPWTEERATRPRCPFQSHGHTLESAHDRSSAHFTAWHSPKREPGSFGEHFKLDDCRVWMRLHFWAMREAGVYEASPGFAEYYIKFIGHFVSVYERTATCFARESARWSADPANIEAYERAGRRMKDVIGVPLRLALRDLDQSEEGEDNWPYGH
eukprot:TRINITY_DN9889_c0_g1_i1.p1 TRINITY_DN9889_c0_g1~~TRINITY_DN9889_c0_g1_i1.p1  ORF type:complete len:272 (-),score=39.10 TRINITY_DN9889_c0_g1_i1:467-1282(-)